MISAINSTQASTPQLRVQATQKQSFKSTETNNESQKQQNLSFKAKGLPWFKTSNILAAAFNAAEAIRDFNGQHVSLMTVAIGNAIIFGAGILAELITRKR